MTLKLKRLPSGEYGLWLRPTSPDFAEIVMVSIGKDQLVGLRSYLRAEWDALPDVELVPVEHGANLDGLRERWNDAIAHLERKASSWTKERTLEPPPMCPASGLACGFKGIHECLVCSNKVPAVQFYSHAGKDVYVYLPHLYTRSPEPKESAPADPSEQNTEHDCTREDLEATDVEGFSRCKRCGVLTRQRERRYMATPGAVAIATKIADDISDRRGIKREWAKIKQFIREDIVQDWADLIDEGTKPSDPSELERWKAWGEKVKATLDRHLSSCALLDCSDARDLLARYPGAKP